MGNRRGACRLLVVRLDGKKPLRSHRRRWEVILRWIFRKWDGEFLDWIDLALDRGT